MTTRSYVDDGARVGTAGLIFSRVLVGVDGSKPGFEACRQAARLADPEAPIEAVAVVQLADAMWAAYNAPQARDQLRQEAEAALAKAVQLIGNQARPRFINGVATAALMQEIERTAATLVAVGSHGHRRVTEILIGGVAGELLHSAQCSVLVARPPVASGTFPRSIVVGLDGSAGAEHALQAAEHLATRFSLPLRAIVAVDGKSADLGCVRRRWPSVEEVEAKPVAALVTASRTADLLVVGSRGLHGVRALGSVSERVAHQAACSVLVVRPSDVG